MSEAVLLDRILSLPAVDIAALLQGQVIAALPNVFVQEGWKFMLYPHVEAATALPTEQKYRSHILPLTRATIAYNQSETVAIEAWARCEYCKMLTEVEQVEALSSLSIWTKEALRKALDQRQHLFLAFLRVYRMPKLIKVDRSVVAPEKFGKFVGLPILGEQFNKPFKITQILPVVNDAVFNQRSQQLKELRPPMHPELEELQSAIAQLSPSSPASQALDHQIKVFLGWTDDSPKIQPDLDSVWIKTLVTSGSSSDGDLFEKMVRKSLIELGFSNSNQNPKASLDPKATGGAGGLDVYCEAPFPLVGECKASKYEKVPNSVSAQLIHLGNTHLGKQKFDQSIKVIFTPGILTEPAEKAALENQMNVIHPETLQRLVELKKKYPGSINLIDLKPCLESAPFGEDSDLKLHKYMDKIEQGIKIRSDLIESVKHLTKPGKTQIGVVEISTCYDIKFAENYSHELDKETAYDLLKELASPLVGCLGRVGANSLNSDRFYFLRDLPIA
ncbi:MAG: DUF1802 family protein [Oscillatoriophycideae cyanobacterium NC_groundwater_1537_Pr4_S-0.65um_50_18]|nr:DUF1802 family protein [Oscillatoriophycideae cyanobacterium NC_groundwater_1537_Pr4_S-0.65um_50_18]